MAQKKIEEMTDHEILIELLKEKRAAAIRRYIAYAIIAALIIFIAYLCFVYIPVLKATIEHYRQTIAETEIIINDIQKNYNEVDWEALTALVDNLNKTFATFDFEGFRESLEKAQEGINALSSIFSRFIK